MSRAGDVAQPYDEGTNDSPHDFLGRIKHARRDALLRAIEGFFMEVYPQCVRLIGWCPVDLDLVNLFLLRHQPIAPARRIEANAVALVGVLIDSKLLALGDSNREG